MSIGSNHRAAIDTFNKAAEGARRCPTPDVEDALAWLREVAGIAEDSDRRYSKLDGFHRWQKMLEAAHGVANRLRSNEAGR